MTRFFTLLFAICHGFVYAKSLVLIWAGYPGSIPKVRQIIRDYMYILGVHTCTLLLCSWLQEYSQQYLIHISPSHMYVYICSSFTLHVRNCTHTLYLLIQHVQSPHHLRLPVPPPQVLQVALTSLTLLLSLVS